MGDAGEDVGDGAEDAADASPTTCPAVDPSGPTERPTTEGTVVGVDQGGVWRFLGIPYAAPPLGARRFRAPEPPPCHDGGVLDARNPGPWCPQLADGSVIGEEDCLTLSVWTPGTVGADLPVLYWIHGGGNHVGSGSEPLYAGETLARDAGVVVVTVQYRLGPLGFLAHPDLTAEGGNGSSGNYAILDHLRALRWLQDNVASFGGDPERVTVAGQSAGAQHAWILAASPLASGLLAGAIAHSGIGFTLPLFRAEAEGLEATAIVGCRDAPDVPACLRALPADELVAALPGTGGVGNRKRYFPSVDGWILDAPVLEQLGARGGLRVPVLSGTTTHETALDRAIFYPELDTIAELEETVRRIYGPAYGEAIVDEALAEYAPAEDTPAAVARAFVDLTTDERFACATRRWLARAADTGEAPVYHYVFERLPGSGPLVPFGAFHGWDLVYLFGNWGDFGRVPYAPNAGDVALARALRDHWRAFLATGDPALPDQPWPPHGDEEAFLRLDDPRRLNRDFEPRRCDLWDRAQRTLEARR